MTTKWKFSLNDIVFMRFELIFIVVLSLLVYLLMRAQFAGRGTVAFLMALIFITLYALLSHIIRALRQVEETYTMSSSHINITRKAGKKVRKHKIPLKDIGGKRIARFFLDGYFVTKQGKRYALYFNHTGEIDSFEKHLRKHLKPTRKKSKKKR